MLLYTSCRVVSIRMGKTLSSNAVWNKQISLYVVYCWLVTTGVFYFSSIDVIGFSKPLIILALQVDILGYHREVIPCDQTIYRKVKGSYLLLGFQQSKLYSNRYTAITNTSICTHLRTLVLSSSALTDAMKYFSFLRQNIMNNLKWGLQMRKCRVGKIMGNNSYQYFIFPLPFNSPDIWNIYSYIRKFIWRFKHF